MTHTLSQNALAIAAFPAAAFTNGTQSATGVDLQGASFAPYRRACFIIQLNTGAATTGNFVIQDSPDNSAWTTVTGATLGTAQAATTGGIYMVDVDLAKRQRYIRVQVVGTGTAGAASADLILFEGAMQSPTQSQTAILV